MTVLILNRASIAANPYIRWLDGYPGDVLLLTSQAKLDTFGEELPHEGFAHSEAFTGYDTSSALLKRALELARRYNIRHVVAFAEFDLERAAALRELLGLPGQSRASARAFRDKVVMKEALSAGGVPVAAYRDVRTAIELLTFDMPMVVKPRNGAAGFGTRVLRDPADRERYLATMTRTPGYQPNLMVERFIEGAFYHVDGIVRDGKVVLSWPARYFGSIMSGPRDAPFGDVMLDPDDPLTGRLIDVNERALRALPAPQLCTFHTEVFHTPSDELIVCEVASRTGGAKVKNVLEAAFGIDVNEYWIRSEVGLPVPDLARPAPSSIAGEMLFPPRPGTVRTIPDRLAVPVTEYEVLARPGDVLSDSSSSTDCLAMVVAAGDDANECRRLLDQAHRDFEANVMID